MWVDDSKNNVDVINLTIQLERTELVFRLRNFRDWMKRIAKVWRFFLDCITLRLCESEYNYSRSVSK